MGLETMSLLIRLPFFGNTGPEDGKLTDGGVDLMGGTGLESGKSSYLGPATASGVGSAFAPQRNREGNGVGISVSKS
jgi:hypothetical protein